MINFWFGENVVYTIFKANAWRGVTADNFPLVLVFYKRRIKSSCNMFSCVAYFETLLQLSLHLCQFTGTHWNFGKKWLFIIFSKKCLFSAFLHIETQLSLTNAGLPPVFFLDPLNMSNAGDFSWSCIRKDVIQVQKGKGKFIVVCPRPP